jgi:hypothetical protein
MLGFTEVLMIIPQGLGVLWLRLVFTGEEADPPLTAPRFRSLATCYSGHGILLLVPRR